MIAASITIEANHLIWNRHFNPEFLCLIVGPRHQRHARNTSWKAQIVLDPCGGASLSTECAAIECQHRKPLGATIDGCGKPGGPGTDDNNVKQTIRVDGADKAQAARELRFARIVQKASIRTKHNGQSARIDVETFDHRSGLRVHFGIELLMGMTVAAEKTGEPEHMPVSRAADDDWPARTDLKQADSPKNERSHDTLTEFCLSNQ